MQRGFEMPNIQKSLRIPAETLQEIETISKETGQDFSNTTIALLSEAIKMRRCPGIVFTEGVRGRRARIAGTGIEVWEVTANYLSLNREYNRLKKSYHWLSSEQLRAALGYFSIYPEEINRLIEQNERWTKEKISQQLPLMSTSG